MLWASARQQFRILFMTRLKGELEHAWYTIQHCMYDLLIAIASLNEAPDKAVNYPRVKIREIYDFMVSTIPRGVLKEEVI